MHVWGNPWARPDPRVSRVRAELGGIDWVGRAHSGPCFLLQSLAGWWGGGAVSGGAVAHPNSDGGIRGDVNFHGRIITLRGKILTDDGAQQMDAFDELTGVFAERRWRTLTVDEPERGMARCLDVTPVSLPELTPVTDKVAEVSLTVESATFPLLDITEQSAVITNAGVSLTNHGNYPAELVVEMRGPLSRPVVLDWGAGKWNFAASVGASQAIDVNMEKRLITSPDSTDHYRQYATGQWLALPPGTTTVRHVGGGSGSLRAVWRSSWS